MRLRGRSSQTAGRLNNRGIAYSERGDYDRAIKDFDEAIRIDPKYVRAYGVRG